MLHEHRQAELLTADWLKDVPENPDIYIAQREFGSSGVSAGSLPHCKDQSVSDSHAVGDVRVRLNHHINQLSKVLMKEIEASPVDLSRVEPEPHAGQLDYSFNLEGQQKPANSSSRTTGRLLSVISRM